MNLVEAIERYVRGIFGGKAIVAENRNQGNANFTFIVTTECEQYILRANAQEEHLKIFNKERLCALRLSSIGICTPIIIDVAQRAEYSFSLQIYLPGLHNSWDDSGKKHAREIGKTLRRIHNIKAFGFGGYIDFDKNTMGRNGLSQWCRYFYKYMREMPINALNDDICKFAFFCSKKLECMICNDYETRLCHGDVSEGNFIFNDDGELVVLDLGSACGHITPQFDFVSWLVRSKRKNKQQVKSLCEGYGIPFDDFIELMEGTKNILLWRILILANWIYSHSNEDRQKSKNRIVGLIKNASSIVDGKSVFNTFID